MPERSQQHRVHFGETDAAGIVYFPNYLRWFDGATHELFRSVGHPLAPLLARGVTFPVIESQARYHSPLFYDDEIEIRCRVAEVRTRAVRIEHQIFRHDSLACAGHEIRIWAAIDQDGTLHPAPIPADIRKALTGESR